MITEKRRKYNREYKRKQRGITQEFRGRPKKNRTKEEKRILNNEKSNNYNRKIRFLALQYYSAPIPFCNCCGEKEIKFLSIDHINGGGNKHRREISLIKGKGGNINHWLHRNNFPEGFQVLCHNCNMAKGFYGQCPHKTLT